MARSTAALLILHVDSRNPWLDSACSPEQPVVVVRPQFSGKNTATFSGSGYDANPHTGQSYDQGAYPPR